MGFRVAYLDCVQDGLLRHAVAVLQGSRLLVVLRRGADRESLAAAAAAAAAAAEAAAVAAAADRDIDGY